VARGDVNWISIGDHTNIQDGTVLHVTHEAHPLDIGRRVVVGHSVVLHGCTVGDDSLIGIGARVLDGAVIEPGSQVAAGAVVVPGSRVRTGYLAMGIPAREARRLSDREREVIGEICVRYRALKEQYREMLRTGGELPQERERDGERASGREGGRHG
jgi:carbonic anhydrase/acetyltransferase-like protein (isoleucine patch superfamily)